MKTFYLSYYGMGPSLSSVCKRNRLCMITFVLVVRSYLKKKKFKLSDLIKIYIFVLVVRSYYPLANEVATGYSNATFRPSHPCEHSRINILQWILTKLGTYLDLKRIWNPIDFQGQRSRSQGLIFRRGDTPRFALPLLKYIFLF